MRSVCIIFFILLFDHSFCQEGSTKELLAQAESTIYSDPQEAIRIAEYISNKSKDKNELIEAAYVLMRSFYLEGNYTKALKVGFKFSEEEFQNENDTQLRIYIILTKILSDLELNELAKKYMEKAIQASQKTKNTKNLNWLKGKTILYNIGSNSEEDTQQNLIKLRLAKNEFKKIPSIQHSFQIGLIDLQIASIHLRELQLDSVPYYLENVYSESKKAKPGNYLEMKCLQEYGNYLLLKKEHVAALDSLKSAMIIAEKFTNIAEQITISEAIAENYLASGDLTAFNAQNEKTDILTDSQPDIENDAVNTAFNFITDNETKKLAKAEKSYSLNIWIGGGVLVFLLLLFTVIVFSYRNKKKQYQSFIDYFEKKQNPEPIIPSKQKNSKHTAVPKEMEETLLKKLSEFEKSTEFVSQDTSLSRLALQFDTNTRYLSEVVNFYKQKNFNAYINELRINYIIDKLKNDSHFLQYKISYLAEVSGFSSHSVFATVFKQVTGIPPTNFITILKDKKEYSDPNKIKK